MESRIEVSKGVRLIMIRTLNSDTLEDHLLKAKPIKEKHREINGFPPEQMG